MEKKKLRAEIRELDFKFRSAYFQIQEQKMMIRQNVEYAHLHQRIINVKIRTMKSIMDKHSDLERKLHCNESETFWREKEAASRDYFRKWIVKHSDGVWDPLEVVPELEPWGGLPSLKI